MDCIFCQIVKGDIPAKICYDDELVLAFDDLMPKAPVHKLIIPKKHISTLAEIEEQDKALLGHLFYTASTLAKQFKIADTGFRVVSNCQLDAGQSVFHIHIHLLGGRKLNWPPG